MLEHQDYLEAVRELTDWLMTAGEELQHWSDTSGDSTSIKKKLSEVRVRKTNICWSPQAFPFCAYGPFSGTNHKELQIISAHIN